MPDKKPDPMQELKGMHIWMLWEWAADKDGKMTKKPFAANGRACGTDEKFSGRHGKQAKKRTCASIGCANRAKGL